MEKRNIDGIDIAYVRRGRGTPMILIHGYPLDHSIWDLLAPLLEQDFDLIIPDLRGFGASGMVEADHSIIAYASDLAGLLTQVKVRNALLVGHSMGGYVALAFAREFPARVLGLAMISSQAVADTAERKAGRYDTAQHVLTEGVETVVDSMPPKLSAQPAVQTYTRELIAGQRPEAIAGALRAMAERPDSSEMFGAASYPVVIVHGDGDALIPVERAREMKAALPAAHYSELGGNGHMPMMENPEAVADALRLFKNAGPARIKLLKS
jgi:3-oxoadipate enol-lactonase